MSDEYKPCPFCGSTEISTEMGLNLNYCDKCSAEANIEHWNTRPLEDALLKRAERAEAMVERLIEERKQLIAQLAAEKDKNEHMLGCIFEYETIAPDGELGVSLLNMDNHIRSLEADNAELKRKLANAEQMVERLIEAGERLSIHSRMVDDIDVWNALVAEWQANQKGDSNV
jgi:predicted RNase H-like nuclease (RuvC/YqgF family)